MNPTDEITAKLETKRQSANAAAGSDDNLKEQLRAAFQELQLASLQPRPVEELHRSDDNLNKQLHVSAEDLSPQRNSGEDVQSLLSRISHDLDYETWERKTIYYRLAAIEKEIKRRRSRGFAHYLVAICIGVAATLAWQSYGEATKWIVATRAPELGWSPETKQMIASWVQQLGWTKPWAGPESTAVRPSPPETPQASPVAQTAQSAAVASSAPDPVQVHQITLDLAALRQTVEQLVAGQNQTEREVNRLQAADMEILARIPSPPAQSPAAPMRRPTPMGPPSSRHP
jgi:hypothetical protein